MIQKLHSNTVSLDFLHCEILHSPSYLLHHFDQFLVIVLHWLQRREGFCFINSRKFYKHRSFERTFQIFSHDNVNNLTETLKKKIETHEQLYNHVTKETETYYRFQCRAFFKQTSRDTVDYQIVPYFIWYLTNTFHITVHLFTHRS